MAIIKNGINGSVSGKAGPSVFVVTKRGNYVRSLPRKKKNRKLSAEEQNTRTHFKLVRQTVSNFLTYIRMGFAQYNPPQRAYDAAMSYNMKKATVKTEDGYIIDWEKFMISKGLPNPVTSYTIDTDTENNVMTIAWEFEEHLVVSHRLGGYNCHIVLYTVENDTGIGIPVHSNDFTYPLSHGKQEIPLDKSTSPATYHIYLFFFAFDSSNKSTDSMYLGTVEW